MANLARRLGDKQRTNAVGHSKMRGTASPYNKRGQKTTTTETSNETGGHPNPTGRRGNDKKINSDGTVKEI